MRTRSKVAVVVVVAAAAAGLWLLVPASRTPEPRQGPAARPAPTPPPAPPTPEPPAPAPAPPAATQDSPAGPAETAKTGRVRITVLGPGESPLSGAAVSLTVHRDGVLGPAAAKETDSGGIALFADESPGHFRLSVRAAGFVRTEGWGEVRAGEDTALVIRLENDGLLRGRVATASGEGIPGAEVAVFRAEVVGPMVLPSHDDPLGTARTGEDGTFSLDGGPREEVLWVTAAAHGYVERGRQAQLPEVGEPGQELLFVLPPAGCLAGAVRDSAGEPAKDVLVCVAPAEDEDLLDPDRSSGGMEGPRRARTARTAADGSFEVDGLPLGEVYVARAEARDGRRTGIEREIAPTAAGPRVRRDLRFAKESVLRVRVLGPDGRPPPGAFLDLVHRDYEYVEQSVTPRGPGEFDVRPPGPGEEAVFAAAWGLVHQVRRVALGEGETKEIEIRLEKGCALEGVVVDDLGEPRGDAIIEASRVRDDEDDSARWTPAIRTNAAGRFVVGGLLPGAHRLSYRHGEDFRFFDDREYQAPGTGIRIVVPRSATVTARLRLPQGATPPDSFNYWEYRPQENGRTGSGDSVRWGDGTVLWKNVEPGKAQFEVRIKGYLPVSWDVEVPASGQLDLGEAVLDPGHTLEGRVVDAAGKPLSGVGVSAGREDDREGWSRIHGHDSTDATTGADGRFSIRHLPAGETSVRTWAEGWLGKTTSSTLPGVPVTLVLVRGAVVRGKVLLPEGMTAEGLVLKIETASGTGSPHSTAHGFGDDGAFEARLPAGRWLFLVKRESGVILGSAEASVVEGGTADVSVDCRK